MCVSETVRGEKKRLEREGKRKRFPSGSHWVRRGWCIVLFFPYFLKLGSLRLGFWTVGVRIGALQRQWCLFYTSDSGKAWKSQRRLWITAFLVCLRAKEPVVSNLQWSAQQNTKLSNNTSRPLPHFCHFCLPFLGRGVISECTVSHLIKQ